MVEELIVHTQVNDVVGGAISNVTLNVEKAGSIVLSATIDIGETSVGKLQSARVNTDNEQLIKDALSAITAELSSRGIGALTIDSVNGDMSSELTVLCHIAGDTFR